MGRSFGYPNGATGVERSRRFGAEMTLGLDEVQQHLVKTLMNPEVDLGARNAALMTLEQHHRCNPAVATILDEHFYPMKDDLREKPVVPPSSPR